MQNLLWWLFAALWFAGWHLVITHSVWADPLYRVPGPIGDNTVMLWNIGWVRYAFEHGSPGFWFKNAYYPGGFLFLYGTPTWLDGFLYWLASPLLPRDYSGAILWANITMLLGTVCSGLAIVGVLKAWRVRQWSVLLLAASGAAFCWFRIYAMSGHYHFSGTHWMLLSVCITSWGRAALLQGDSRVFLRRCAAAGLLIGISYLNDQALAVFAAVLCVLILVSLVWGRLRTVAGGLALLGLCAACVAAVHLVPTALALASGKVAYDVDPAPRLVDASSLILPPDWHFLGPWLAPVRERYGLMWAEGTYLGMVPMVLLLLATGGSLVYLLSGRGRRMNDELEPPWKTVAWSCAAAWLFIVCALGDKLMLGQQQLVTFPGRLLKEIPVINNIRLPQRWIWPAQLCIALSGGLVLSRWLNRGETRGWRGAWTSYLLIGLAVIPPLEACRYPSIPPLDYQENAYLRPPGLLEAIKNNYQGGSILTMPAEKAYGHANVFQFMLGYDYPMAMTYTARMPFKPGELPWQDSEWTPAAGDWLRQKDVRMLVFPFEQWPAADYQDWVKQAKNAVPGLIALDRKGDLI